MKGYYVIWSYDTEEFKTKREALKRAKKIKEEFKEDVAIQQFNDSWENGYLSESEMEEV